MNEQRQRDMLTREFSYGNYIRKAFNVHDVKISSYAIIYTFIRHEGSTKLIVAEKTHKQILQ